MKKAIALFTLLTVLLGCQPVDEFIQQDGERSKNIAGDESCFIPVLRWSQVFAGINKVSFVGNDQLFCTFQNRDSCSYALVDSNTGKTLWRNRCEAECKGLSFSSKSYGETVFVHHSGEESLNVVDIKNGHTIDELDCPAELDLSSCVFFHDDLIFVDKKMRLIRFDGKTKKTLFDVETTSLEMRNYIDPDVHPIGVAGNYLFFIANSSICKLDMQTNTTRSLEWMAATPCQIVQTCNEHFVIAFTTDDRFNNTWSIMEIDGNGDESFTECGVNIINRHYLFLDRLSTVIHMPGNAKNCPVPIHCSDLGGELQREIHWSRDMIYHIAANKPQTQLVAHNRRDEIAVWSLGTEKQ